jgi:hypothetical protein
VSDKSLSWLARWFASKRNGNSGSIYVSRWSSLPAPRGVTVSIAFDEQVIEAGELQRQNGPTKSKPNAATACGAPTIALWR